MNLYDLSLLNWIFLVCALLGGALFIVRIILMIFGAGGSDVGDASGDVATDVHADLSGGHDAGHHGDSSDASFKVFTLQGIMAFLLMFGALGLALDAVAGIPSIVAVLCAILAGALTMWLAAWVFSSLMGLQSDGTVDIRNTIGKEGTVYQRILPGGTGKVQVVVQNRLMEYEAVCEKDVELKTGETVMVVYYKGNTLVVDKI